MQQVLTGFDPSKHPRVANCEMTQDEVRDRLEADLRELGASDNAVSQEVFYMYFEELSACIPPEKDFFFDQTAGDCFNPPSALSVPVERLEQLARVICAKFHHQDKGATGGLGPEEFAHLLVSVGMNLPSHERGAFFDYLAASCGGGRIEFKSFSSLLRKISEIPPLPDKTAEGAGDGGGDTLLEGGAKAPEKLIEKIKKHMVRYHPQGV